MWKILDLLINFDFSMFVNYPEWQEKFFVRISGLTIPELRSSPVLKAHSSHVFHVVANLVEHMEHTDVIVEAVKKVARTHWPLNIRMPELDAGIKLLIDYLKEALGENLNPEGEVAWTKLLSTMSTVLTVEQKRLDDEGYDLGGWNFKPGSESDDFNMYRNHTHINLPSFDEDNEKKKNCNIM